VDIKIYGTLCTFRNLYNGFYLSLPYDDNNNDIGHSSCYNGNRTFVEFRKSNDIVNNSIFRIYTAERRLYNVCACVYISWDRNINYHRDDSNDKNYSWEIKTNHLYLRVYDDSDSAEKLMVIQGISGSESQGSYTVEIKTISEGEPELYLLCDEDSKTKRCPILVPKQEEYGDKIRYTVQLYTDFCSSEIFEGDSSSHLLSHSAFRIKAGERQRVPNDYLYWNDHTLIRTDLRNDVRLNELFRIYPYNQGYYWLIEVKSSQMVFVDGNRKFSSYPFWADPNTLWRIIPRGGDDNSYYLVTGPNQGIPNNMIYFEGSGIGLYPYNDGLTNDPQCLWKFERYLTQ